MANEIRLKLAIDGGPAVSSEIETVGKSLNALGGSASAAAGNVKQALGQLNMSAKQSAVAMRNVPAQFTDIVVSLQAGQAPLTVLLQQGGQLKDMFGGVGNAAKALGGYVLGLVNPYTVAAAAAAGLAIAYEAGASESHALSNALILSGNSAGTSSSSMMAMAASIDKITGTKGGAVEALAQVAQFGKVSEENLEKFTTTAIRFEKVSGIAVSETAKKFAELKDAPLEATVKLNESMGYLTVTLYDQLKALTETGRATEAATLAQKAFDASTASMATQMEKNLGTVERAWGKVKGAVAKTWDAIKGIGRDAGIEGQVAAAQKMVDVRRQAAESIYATAGDKDKLSAAQNQLLGYQELLKNQQLSAKYEGERVEATKDYVAWQKEGEKHASKQEKMTRELTAAAIAGQREILRGTITQQDLEQRFANIREANKETATPKVSTAGESEIAGIRARVIETQKYIDALTAGGIENAKLNEGEKLAIKIKEELLTSISGVARANKVAALAEAEKLAALLKTSVAEENHQKAIKKSADEYQNLIDTTYKGADSITEQASRQEAANAVFGKGKSAIEAMTLAELNHQMAEAQGSDRFSDQYIAGLQAKIDAQTRYAKSLDAADYKTINAHTAELLRSAKELDSLYKSEADYAYITGVEREKIIAMREVEIKFAKELAKIEASNMSDDEKAAQRQVVNQAKQIEGSAAVSKVMQSDWAKTVEKYDDIFRTGFSGMLNNGKDAWSAFSTSLVTTFKTSVADQIYKMFAQPFVIKMVGSMAGMIGLSGFSGSAAAGQSGGNALTSLSTVQSLKSLYDTASGGLNIGAKLGQYLVDNVGNQLVGDFAAGMTNVGSIQSATMAAQAGGAQLAGVIAGSVLNGVSGYGISKALSGGFSIDGFNVNAIAGIASMIPGIGPIAGVIGGLVNRAFGQGATEVRAQGTEGTFSASGFSGNNYAQMHRDGGWFSSDSDWKTTSALAASTVKAWNSAFSGVKVSVAGMATSLGLSTDSINSYSKSIDLAAGSSAETITAMFTGMADDIAASLAPGLSLLAKEGETASVTLSRLGTSLSTTNQWLDMLGHSLLGVSLAGGNAASKLADTFGGLDKFTASSKAFYETYYSETERTARSQQDMAKALALVGLALPDTKADLRALATTLDLTSDSGRTAYAVLMTIAPEFAATTDALDKLATEATASLLKTFTLAGNVDYAGIGKALTTANTQTFVATVNQAFVGLTVRIKTLVDGIATERKAVADASAQISGPKEITYAGLQGEIAAIKAKSGLPSDAGVISANLALAQANSKFTTSQKVVTDSGSAVNRAQGAVADAASYAAALPSTFDLARQQLYSAAQGLGLRLNTIAIDKGQVNTSSSSAYSYDAASNRLRGWDYSSYWDSGASNLGRLYDSQGANITLLTGANAKLAASEKSVVAAQASLSQSWDDLAVANKSLNASAAEKTAAEAAAKKATLDYAAAAQAYVVQASKSVPALTKLREETVAYYEAQKALAAGMTASATGLRSAAVAMRLSQLDSVASTAQKQADFAKNYSLALTTSGADKAGYADKMAAALPALSDALKETSTLRDWSIATAQLAAQSNTIASQLDVAAAVDYQGQSLGLLASIDSTLAVLDDSTASITRAIAAGSDLTAAGLRGIITQLGGVPAFAGGGYHSGGLRIVGENSPELEVTGPSRIFNAAQIRSMLSGGTQGGGSGQLEALVAELLKEVASLRVETRAITVHSANTADNTRRMERNGVLVFTDPAAPIDTKVTA